MAHAKILRSKTAWGRDYNNIIKKLCVKVKLVVSIKKHSNLYKGMLDPIITSYKHTTCQLLIL